MNKLLVGALFGAFVMLGSTAAVAGDRAYVSKNGVGAACSLAAPCATFFAALTVAGVEGEVICLDSGFFGSLAITNSVSIMCENHIGQAGATINTINTPAGSTVVLNGIDIDERNFGGDALNFSGQGTLIIRNSTIRNATNGVRFAPNGNAKLVITNTNFESSSAAGVLIDPQAAGTFQVNMDGVRANGNQVGVSVYATGGETVNLEIRDSGVQQNTQFGVRSSSGAGSAASQILIENSSISNNAWGVFSTGATSVVRINRSVLSQNNIGLNAVSGGKILSYGNNAINSVSATGGPTGTIGLQ